MSEPIVRIAARGDGVTASGRHIAFAAPGDILLDDGSLQPGPGHQQPPCSLFPQCGGCQLQHLTDEAYVAASRSELELQRWIVFRNPANVVKNLLGEKRIVNRA